MSQPGYQAIVTHILPNIARSKGNQKIKFGQLIECNVWNNKSQTLFWKIKIESISGSII